MSCQRSPNPLTQVKPCKCMMTDACMYSNVFFHILGNLGMERVVCRVWACRHAGYISVCVCLLCEVRQDPRCAEEQ